MRVDTLPAGLPDFVADSVFTRANVDFGGYLFASTVLSADGKISCLSCHDPRYAYADPRPRSRGVYGRTGARNAPALQNLYARRFLMWDGRAELIDQPRLPLDSHREMDVPWPRALRALDGTEEARAWRRETGRQELTRAAVIASLSAFLRSLVSGGSRFDAYRYRGNESALTEDERRGWKLFSGKAGCVRCHTAGDENALFADDRFHALGVGYKRGAYSDAGRGGLDGTVSDVGKFRTPSLRNVSRTSPYMHDGNLPFLLNVVRFYDFGAGAGAFNLDSGLVPLELNEHELADLVAFLGSLEAPIVQYYPW